MKKSIFCLFFSITFFVSQSFSQDTIYKMVNGTNLHEFNNNMKIISSTDHYNEHNYRDYELKVKKNQILVLDLYDDCKYCKLDINCEDNPSYRIIIIKKKSAFNKETTEIQHWKSCDSTYYIDGNKISSIRVCKPNLKEI